ncbi:hypothetical protein [Mesorhizobium sp. LSJC280B00]|uniref:hypothetical protein n=1 Tax=Mesorhizobium sp. LSJC280B00 TaxID=1287336 RepID=UPI0003CEAB9E|nr:hypothetical protein [Mesorhizobium sp. LSJC280B00]ESW66241.1 hypothetical protein X772_35140 [Mesorhizobium sp. LSJC280B00]
MTPAEQISHYEEQRRLFYVGITRVRSDLAHGKPGTLVLTYFQQMPLADAMRAGINPAYVSYGNAFLQASPYIAEMDSSSSGGCSRMTTLELPALLRGKQ